MTRDDLKVSHRYRTFAVRDECVFVCGRRKGEYDQADRCCATFWIVAIVAVAGASNVPLMCIVDSCQRLRRPKWGDGTCFGPVNLFRATTSDFSGLLCSAYSIYTDGITVRSMIAILPSLADQPLRKTRFIHRLRLPMVTAS